jgi:hypothetical protein
MMGALFTPATSLQSELPFVARFRTILQASGQSKKRKIHDQELYEQ